MRILLPPVGGEGGMCVWQVEAIVEAESAATSQIFFDGGGGVTLLTEMKMTHVILVQSPRGVGQVVHQIRGSVLV